MSSTDLRREFAVDVVAQLRGAGYEALWAGGCVRDFLLGKTPKDYDVATTATPDEVRKLFGHRRTVPVGASFGVIMVLGPTKEAGQIEVATFRTEGEYVDGRRPGRVAYCTPEEDAKRRDFTINGMFYDPIVSRVLDYVGGEADLAAGVLRAIGNPRDRMTEDKLRMLRAVRFAATLEFELDPATADAVQSMAAEIHIVSAERIAQELRRMLIDPRRRRAMELAESVGLLREILPELTACGVAGHWNQTLHMLHLLQHPTFELAFATLVHQASEASGKAPPFNKGGPGGVKPKEPASEVISDEHKSLPKPTTQADRKHKSDPIWAICRRLKLSNDESEAITWLVAHQDWLDGAPAMPLAELKRKLAHPLSRPLLELMRVERLATQGDLSSVVFCRDYLTNTPADVINPSPLITGADLPALGVPPGPAYKEWLDKARDAQLNGEVATRDEALEWIRCRL